MRKGALPPSEEELCASLHHSGASRTIRPRRYRCLAPHPLSPNPGILKAFFFALFFCADLLLRSFNRRCSSLTLHVMQRLRGTRGDHTLAPQSTQTVSGMGCARLRRWIEIRIEFLGENSCLPEKLLLFLLGSGHECVEGP